MVQRRVTTTGTSVDPVRRVCSLQRSRELSFTVKSLLSDMYLDDLRDKTRRGLEGRALAGFATGNVLYGFHTVPVTDAHGARSETRSRSTRPSRSS